MITRLKLSTIEQGLPKYRSMLAGNDAYQPTAFESIASATGTGSSSTITFSSIPSTYQHLQIRAIGRSSSTGNTAYIRFNSDTGANYARHMLRGTGTAVSAGGSASVNEIEGFYLGASFDAANIMGTGILDIHDYSSTSKNKTVRVITGKNDNGAGDESLYLFSGLWRNTSAINSITIYIPGANNFTTTSTFALYGIKG